MREHHRWHSSLDIWLVWGRGISGMGLHRVRHDWSDLAGAGARLGPFLIGFHILPLLFFFPTSEAFYLHVLHPQASLVVQMVNHLPTIQETGVQIPESGRSPGEGNGTPLQYSCLENPMDRGAWWAAAHGVAESQTRLSNFAFTYIPRKGIQGFSLLWIFVLLLHGPWCQLRLSVQWNQTDRMGAAYSAILLDLWVALQIWGWSLHTYLACLWGSQQFSQPCDHQWFHIRQCNHASSSQLETWRWLWSTA